MQWSTYCMVILLRILAGLVLCLNMHDCGSYWRFSALGIIFTGHDASLCKQEIPLALCSYDAELHRISFSANFDRLLHGCCITAKSPEA